MNNEFSNVLETIGKMPLVRLNSITKESKSIIYVKLEFLF